MVCRTYKSNEYCNIYSFLTVALIAVFCAAFIYEFVIMEPDYPLRILVIILFAIIASLVVASYIATSCTEPGKVPFYFGLTRQNTTTSVQKYCVICHNFKPERSHHCSTCRKCVMNMDHHCPWVNNCIGFHNRKFFLQFVGYLTIGLLLTAIVGVFFLVGDFKRVIETSKTNIHFALRLILTLTSITMMFILGTFFAFHFNMILENTTTLQGLLRKRHEQKRKNRENNGYYMKQKTQEQSEIPEETIPDYDIGTMQNFYQAFGENGFYWFLPFYGEGPKGNGTYWPRNEDENVMMTGGRQNLYTSLRKY